MLIRSTLFSRLSYMSRENTELGSELQGPKADHNR